MSRPVVLSNGQLFIGLDENGLVHDYYYPYVGLENLNGARVLAHKIGVWVDGNFKWTDDGSWKISLDFESDAMVSEIKMHSDELNISLLLQDYVDIDTNSFVRHITATNHESDERDVRIFMHQVFQISRTGRSDTAIYVPDENYILDYKGRFCILVAGKFQDGQSFDQYAVGNYAIEGKAGTYLDATDGELSNNAVEHGGVDTVIRFSRHIEGGQSATLDYWIVADSSQQDVQETHTEFKRIDMENRLNHVRQHWHAWLAGGNVEIPHFNRKVLEKSLLVIKAHCDSRGSVLASGDSSIFNFGRDYYCYCWPRDASYALWPLIRLGHFTEAKLFFEFARDTMHKNGYLMHKYQPDRAIGSTWHPLVHGRSKELAIQEDETAITVFMIGEYYQASKDKVFVENIYRTFVQPCAKFMCTFIDEATGLPHASYDLWEEKFLTSTYTVCSVIAGLEAAARLAEVSEEPADAVRWEKAAEGIRSNLNKLYSPDNYFTKGFLLLPDGTLQYDNTMDISNLYGPYMFGGLELDDERLISTAKVVEARLMNQSPIGGVIRHEQDYYFLAKHQYQGNPWIVCSLWMAQYYAINNRLDEAQKLLDWSLARQMPSGALSEQFDPDNGMPVSVTPLVWSHSEMVNTLLDMSKYNKASA
ncbi:MAG TPA: glycoside hydrolase family 15 protein [Candidatus Sulfotelmatobacter sp.]|nr:glycoside hydrolase family 15 protein [Candidatus Sulfotelmatobacter sp.]